MDRLNADQKGFLPGVFGKRQKQGSSLSKTESTKLEPKPHPFLTNVLPPTLRNEVLAMAGEFVGTFMFLFIAFAGTQIANTPSTFNGTTQATTGPNTSVLLYVALSFGFSLTVNAWIFFRVTGGLFNPAVTLGLCLIGAVPFSRGLLVFIAQMLAGMASAGVVSALFPGPLAVTTTLQTGTSAVQGLFIEAFLTAQLAFTIFMLAAEKHKSTFLAPIGIGLSLFIAELAGVYFTGGSLNPTRSFGPCVVTRSFPSYHWIYWVGPCLGALMAAGFFWFIKSCEYETVNPGQDFDDLEANAYNPDVDLTRPVVQPTAQLDQSRQSTANDPRMDDLMEGRQLQPQYKQERYPVDRTQTQRYSQDRYQGERYSNERYREESYPEARDHEERYHGQRYHGDSTGHSNTYTIAGRD